MQQTTALNTTNALLYFSSQYSAQHPTYSSNHTRPLPFIPQSHHPAVSHCAHTRTPHDPCEAEQTAHCATECSRLHMYARYAMRAWRVGRMASWMRAARACCACELFGQIALSANQRGWIYTRLQGRTSRISMRAARRISWVGPVLVVRLVVVEVAERMIRARADR
jgi:hypothetical protein